MNVTAIKTGIFKEREDLPAFISKYIPVMKDGSVLVVTSKIAALAEGRTVDTKDMHKAIRAESEWVKKTKLGSVTLKDGIIMWNAGIDESNAGGRPILLPKSSFRAAAKLRTKLKKIYGIKRLGVILSDSRIMPLRAGVVGIALGYAGFKGVRDYRGTDDMFGRKLKYTSTDIADGLATAAVVVMGEGSEMQPLCVIEDAPVEFRERIDPQELIVRPQDDMYRPLFRFG